MENKFNLLINPSKYVVIHFCVDLNGVGNKVLILISTIESNRMGWKVLEKVTQLLQLFWGWGVNKVYVELSVDTSMRTLLYVLPL